MTIKDVVRLASRTHLCQHATPETFFNFRGITAKAYAGYPEGPRARKETMEITHGSVRTVLSAGNPFHQPHPAEQMHYLLLLPCLA
jgi:hypothetical protein